MSAIQSLDRIRLIVSGGRGPSGVSDADLSTKADRYPADPFSPVVQGYNRLYTGWLTNFYDEANSRIRPVYPLGPVNAATPNNTAGAKQVPWMWAIAGVSVLYEEWRRAVSAGDAAATSAAAAKLAGDWTAFKAAYTATDITSGVYGTNKVSGLSDDSAWFSGALRQIHEVTGDATALTYLVEFIASTTQIFRCTRDPQNTLIDSGYVTPGGLAFKYNTLGYLYAAEADPGGIATFGYVSGIQEVWLAYSALYVSRQSDLPAPLRTAYRNYAEHTWANAFANFRTPQVTDPTRCVGGLYYCSYNLDPAVGTSASLKRPPDPNEVYHRGEAAYFGRPLRALSSVYDVGAQAMAALSGWLYQLTNDAKYLTELKSVATAYPALNGFGRVYQGVPCIGNLRDPWGDAVALPEMVRWLLTLTTIGDFKPLASAIMNSSRNVISQSGNGFCSPDWSGPELNLIQGTTSWEEDANLQYGGAQGRREQIVTTGSSMGLLAAAMQLTPYTNLLASGVSRPVSIETLAAEIASVKVAAEATTGQPIRWSNRARTFWNRLASAVSTFINDKEVMRLQPDQTQIYNDLHVGGDVIGGIGKKMYPNEGDSFQWLGKVFDRPALVFDDKDYFDYDRALNAFRFVVNNALAAWVNGDGSAEFGGQLRSSGWANTIQPGFQFGIESGNPVIYFAGSGNKILFDINGAVIISIGGTKQFRLDGNGNVQIRGTIQQNAAIA